jgi:hypothetical protein
VKGAWCGGRIGFVVRGD